MQWRWQHKLTDRRRQAAEHSAMERDYVGTQQLHNGQPSYATEPRAAQYADNPH